MNKRPRFSTCALDDASWAVVDEAIRQLEDSWELSPGADLAKHAPPPGDPLRKLVVVELIKTDQELQWASEQPKSVESYLNEWPELHDDPDAVAELVEAECITRAAFGDMPTPEELQTRFPALQQQVDLRKVESLVEGEMGTLLGPTNEPPAKGETGTLLGPTNEAPARDTSGTGLVDTAPKVDQEAPPPLEKRFGRYVIRQTLGQGGMGMVYRAFDTELERDVALKIPRLDSSLEATLARRLVREAKAAAKIQHPNICPIFDAGQMDGVYFITMALIDGETLSDRIEQRPLDPVDAAGTVRKLAGALHVVHTQGIIHRDIKPSNVMINRSGEPLLMDFGLARDLDSATIHTDSGGLVGTVPYMSPEQVDGEALDARSDIYSLGVLFYETLAGRLPFRGKLTELLSQIARSQPPKISSLRPGLDPALEAICQTAMAKNPADRYQTAEDFANALRDCHPSPAGKTPLPTARRRCPGWLTAAAASLLVVAGLAGGYLMSDRDPAEGEGTIVLIMEAKTMPFEMEDVNVLLDGEPISASSGRVAIPASVGTHQLVVSYLGETIDRSLTIERPNQTLEEKIQLPDPGPWKGELKVEFHCRRKVPGEEGEYELDERLEANSPPLRDGDLVCLHAELSDEGFAYVYWVDSEGSPERLFPPVDVPAREHRKHDTIVVPSPGQWFPLEDFRSLEVVCIVVTARRQSEEDLQRFERSLRDLEIPTISREAPRFVEFTDRYRPQPDTNTERGVGAPVSVPDERLGIEKARGMLAEHIDPCFDAYHGWILASE